MHPPEIGLHGAYVIAGDHVDIVRPVRAVGSQVPCRDPWPGQPLSIVGDEEGGVMVYGYHRASGCVIHFPGDRVCIDNPGNEVSDKAVRSSYRANHPEVLVQDDHPSRSSDKDRAVSQNG